MKKILDGIRWFINSNWNIALYILLSALGWCFGYSHLTLLFMALYSSISIFLTGNINSILVLFLGAPYITSDWTNPQNMMFNIISIAVAAISLISFVIYKIYVKKQPIKKGKLKYFFVLGFAFYLTAGLIGYFSIINFAITIAICLIVYLYYFLVLNFTTDTQKCLNKAIIGICFIIIFELIFKYATCEDILDAIQHKTVRIGAGEINTSAIYLGVGICSSFLLGLKNNCAHKSIPLATLFIVGTFFTYSRIALAVNCVIFVIGYFLTYKQTKEKNMYLIYSVFTLCAMFITFLLIKDFTDEIISYYVEMGTMSNGRDKLWSWCFKRFENSPIFGVGFTWKNAIPSIDAKIGDKYIIYCHNTFIQLLTSTGFLGLCANIPLLIKKYITVVFSKNNFTQRTFTIMQLALIAACGMFDASGGLGIFMTFLIYSLVASCEKSDYENTKKNPNK